MKKAILAILALILIAGGTFFYINSEDNYDKSKYFAKVTPPNKPLSVDSQIDFTLPDQFSKPHSLKEDTKILIMTFSKEAAHTVKNFLKQQPKGYLEEKKAMFIADISPMPTVIRNAFALPDLKKSSYTILLIYDKEIAKKLKNEDKKNLIEIVRLNNKKAEDIKYVKTAKELQEILEK
ncbi:MAG: hypothetical protein GXO31_06230 [Epsilonproteobacteria bacterium]|nr:hypothetical protein [Campylobacterota bacterium]